MLHALIEVQVSPISQHLVTEQIVLHGTLDFDPTLAGTLEVAAAPVHELQPVLLEPLEGVVHGRQWEVHALGDLGIRESCWLFGGLLCAIAKVVYPAQIHRLQNSILNDFERRWHPDSRWFLVLGAIEESGQTLQLNVRHLYRLSRQVAKIQWGNLKIWLHKLILFRIIMPI